MKITRFSNIPKFTRDGSYAVDYPFHSLVKWIEREQAEEGLQLNPDFQRGHVWTETQQIAYVEFMLRGGKTGRTLYFNCPSWNHPVPEGDYNEFVCVDGLQRITAITRFVHSQLPPPTEAGVCNCPVVRTPLERLLPFADIAVCRWRYIVGRLTGRPLRARYAHPQLHLVLR